MGTAQTPESLLALFETVPDPRIDRTKAYSLPEILFLVLSAVVSGENHMTDIEGWGNAKLDWLRTILPYENGIPSHHTIGRVLGLLDPNALEDMFLEWMRETQSAAEGVVAIDGKTVRAAVRRGSSRSFVHMVSAFASASSMVLGQVKADEKSNEITAIPNLLDKLDIAGSLVTIDAMGCQEKIAQKIVDSGADFILGVKENQPTLYGNVVEMFHGIDAAEEPAYDSTVSVEAPGHGRGEYRRCDVVHVDDVFTHRHKWPHIRSLVRVTSERRLKGRVEKGIRYYASSVACHSAEQALASTRAHWGIENKLHWVLDVAFAEDRSTVYAGNAAENLVVVRHIALNLLRAATGLRGGIAARRKQAGWTDAVRYLVLCASPQ